MAKLSKRNPLLSNCTSCETWQITHPHLAKGVTGNSLSGEMALSYKLQLPAVGRLASKANLLLACLGHGTCAHLVTCLIYIILTCMVK